MISRALTQVIDSIHKEQEDLKRQIEAETDEYKKHDLEFMLNTVTNEKLSKTYYEMIKYVPDDEIKNLKGILVGLFDSKESFDRFVENIKNNSKNPTERDICLGMPIVAIIRNFDKTIDGLSRFLSNSDLEKVAKTIKEFIPGSINNTPIHPYEKKIENIKKGEKFNSLPAKERQEVSKQLDEINEVVKESPRKFSDVQTDFDKDYESITNKKQKVFFENYVKQENPDFGKAYEYYDLNFLVKNDIADDPEKISIAKSPSFKLTKETQDSILKVWKKMDELGIISAGDGRESGSKIYGFEKLYNARKKLGDALSEEKFDNLKALKDEYEKQVQNVREMYKIIKQELDPTPEKIPGNVQNFRENFVPAEFKNDICTNASFNGMYNTYSIVKSLGVNPEEFLRNPQPYIDKHFNDEITKFHINKIYKDLSFDETLARVYSDKSKPGLNSHGLPRMVATLTLFEKNPEQKKNDLIFCAVQSGKIASIFDDEQVCYNYFSKERTKSFINLLFANPEDKNFDTMRSFDALSGDRTHKFKAFDLASYLKEKQIPAENIYERITNYLTTAYKLTIDSGKQYAKEQANYNKALEDYKSGKLKTAPEMPNSRAMTVGSFGSMVKDIQQGIISYVMLSNPEKDMGIEKLVGFLKNPAEALKDLNMEERFVEELNGLKNKDVVLNEYKQRAKTEGVLDIKDIRLKENTYNKSAEKILKEANKISLKVANENNPKKVEELQKQSVLKMNQLKQLQKNETERLSREYKSGNIPSEYYKKRVENIISLNHNNKVAIFDDGLDKNEYIKSTGLDQLSKSEKNSLYKCEIEKQKMEKELFLNKQFLQKNNLISTNLDIDVQQANFEQVDVNEIESTVQEERREPLVVSEAKIRSVEQKSESQKEIDPKQMVKMP